MTPKMTTLFLQWLQAD